MVGSELPAAYTATMAAATNAPPLRLQLSDSRPKTKAVAFQGKSPSFPKYKSFLAGSLSLSLISSYQTGCPSRSSMPRRPIATCSVNGIKAVVFDCDGVILESEDLHRTAYNATFEHFSVRCPGEDAGVEWTTEFYDVLQNQIGGGKPKMRWYFNKNGWPHSTLLPSVPTTDEERNFLIDSLQDWKTSKYKDLIGSGAVPSRPGVIRIMDEARQRGMLVAVCSAATKSSVIFTLTNLLGKDRFEALDCFMAGDDVDKKKPDPTIYEVAAQRLNLSSSECLVIEDSVIGLQAALGAGMRCVITYTPSTKAQDFKGAVAMFPDLGDVTIDQLVELVEQSPAPVL